MVVAERLLQRMQLVGGRRDALDGQDVVAIGLHRQHQAGACRTAIEQDGAGAADAVLATEVGPGEAEIIADEIGERDAHRRFLGVLRAVDGDGDGAFIGHVSSLYHLVGSGEQLRMEFRAPASWPSSG